jgi:hypothetical protein
MSRRQRRKLWDGKTFGDFCQNILWGREVLIRSFSSQIWSQTCHRSSTRLSPLTNCRIVSVKWWTSWPSWKLSATLSSLRAKMVNSCRFDKILFIYILNFKKFLFCRNVMLLLSMKLIAKLRSRCGVNRCVRKFKFFLNFLNLFL